MSKKLPAIVLMTTLGAAAALAWLAPQPAQADEKQIDCAGLKKARVKAACTAGANTEKKMREQMKAWQKTAKEKGGEFKCTTCHEKGSGGALKSGADAEWTKFEALL